MKSEKLQHMILLCDPHWTKSLCGLSALRYSATITSKHTNTLKKIMQIFVIKLRIILAWTQINSSLFNCAGVMKILNMLSKIQTNTPKIQLNFLSLCWRYSHVVAYR